MLLTEKLPVKSLKRGHTTLNPTKIKIHSLFTQNTEKWHAITILGKMYYVLCSTTYITSSSGVDVT